MLVTLFHAVSVVRCKRRFANSAFWNLQCWLQLPACNGGQKVRNAAPLPGTNCSEVISRMRSARGGEGGKRGQKFENLRDSMWTDKRPDWFCGLGEFNSQPISCETMRCSHWRAKYCSYVAYQNVRMQNARTKYERARNETHRDGKTRAFEERDLTIGPCARNNCACGSGE
jgi:hypothetical protein